MKKKILIISISILLLTAVGVGAFLYHDKTKFQFNNENAIGNTSGNLNNGGKFCEYNGVIYFANPNDNNTLYSMNSDCSDAKKLSTDSVAYLNVCGSYIYYVRENYKNNTSKLTNGMSMRRQCIGLYRCDLNGKNVKSLYNELSGICSLAGNYIYYQHYDNTNPLSFYRVKIDGTDENKLSATPYDPSCIINGIMYYVDTTKKNNIGAYNTQTNSFSTFFDANAYMISGQGNYLYYIDVSKGYALVRLNISTKTVELLYSNEGKIINYNLYGNKIFFQLESDNKGLYRMNSDGTQVEFIATGDLNNLQCTSSYTFFQYYGDTGVLYRVPTSGPITKVEEITIK